jgi:para-nitrobenzyl esterase
MPQIAGPTATTRSGPVVGVLHPADDAHRRDVSQFSGLPFAAPISGSARFLAPQRETSWSEPRDATSFGDIVPQITSALSTMMGAQAPITGDDCLNLNVWTPSADNAARPVMVWIHGGAYVTGTGSTPWYDGRRFAANHDVVVVTINYRLGSLGYLDVSRLVPDAADLATPNCGLLDQVAALRWVQDCIGSFGGTPSNVTVFGESAGAFSIGALLGCPAATGLFHRAIFQSGAAAHISSTAQADRVAAKFLAALGLAADRGGIAALADVAMDALLAASQAIDLDNDGASTLLWQPTTETESLPVAPLDTVAAGAHGGIDVLFGTTREEMRMFTAFDPSTATIDHDRIVRRLVRSVGDEHATDIARAYTADVDGRSPAETWVEIATDQVFRWPADRLARALHAGGANNMFAYEFEWVTPAFGGVLGSCHALEIPFVFDNLHQRGVAMFTGSGEERQAIADVLHQAWASFAHHGDPNAEGLAGAPTWPQWDPVERATLTVGDDVRVVIDPRGDALRRWPQ